ncbi:MAG: imidazole glycerol phosphate synthase subunit HisH [Bradyrhizobium sp.]|nr:imidazole glycerol phosphate synthase subunit HisH [Bradyrhizobium sp.]
MTVAIIDYGAGDLHSAAKAFERAANDSGCDDTVIVTADPDAVAGADRIVLPGVGAFPDCRKGLDGIPGMVDALERSVLERGRPFFGICVGMQLMAEWGMENGTTPGLGWISGNVEKLAPADASLRIPHMGWNSLETVRSHPVLEGIPLGPNGLNAHFTHSYAMKTTNRDELIAEVHYGAPVAAIVGRNSMFGTQFHPEKSQRFELKLISNFLRWRP